LPREWRILPVPEVRPDLREAVGGHPLVARVLAQRGFETADQALPFLDPDHYCPASPWALGGMGKAVDILLGAIEHGHRVRVWGDYDADGMTATALLCEALGAAGATVDYDLPRRREGHGVSPRAIRDAKEADCRLLLTCDTGITAIDAVAQARAEGLSVIVTDHHDLPVRLPPAGAIVNPKTLSTDHALRELTGVGVAYMVAVALSGRREVAVDLDRLLDLVAVGMIADVAVLTHDVRYLVRRGLAALRSSKRPGLRALVSVANLDMEHLDEDDVGYEIGPRLNAAGRLDDARIGVRLLLTSDDDEAAALAGELERLNQRRKAHTEAAMALAEDALLRDPESARGPVIFVEGNNWQPGVLGLVAGKLASRYDRPAVVLAHRPDGISVASARSVEGIDVHEAISAQGDLLLREGGHPMAAGCSMARENVPVFRNRLAVHLRQAMAERPAAPALEIDAVVPWNEVSLDLARDLMRLGPFGSGNQRPVLALTDVSLVRTADVSTQRVTPHRHLYVAHETEDTLRLTWFNAGELPPQNADLDVAFGLRVGRWRGRERLELDLVDWRRSRKAHEAPAVGIVAGLEVVDWRDRDAIEEAERELRQEYGGQLAVWGEGEGRTVSSVSRTDLPTSGVSALAIATAPPGPAEPESVIELTQPQVVYLLPVKKVPELTAGVLVRRVAAMVRAAVRDHAGRLDPERMAARLGARSATVLAILRGIEQAGSIVLQSDGAGLRAVRATGGLPGGAGHQRQAGARHEESVRPPRDVLAHLLAETAAYRRAFRERPWATFFPRKVTSR